MSRFLRCCAFLSILFFSANAFAEGYTCDPYKRYTACNQNYYLSGTGVGNSCLRCPTNSTTAANNTSTTCTCKTGYTVGGSTTGGTTTTSTACSPIKTTITLNNKNATTKGTATIYATYGTNVYLDSGRTKIMTTSANGITIPKRQYVITYNANSGSVSRTSDTITYTFNGYGSNISSNGKITSTGITNAKNLTANTTWQARWTAPAMPTFPTPTRTGFNFIGWGKAANATTGYAAGESVPAPSASTVYYAIWKPIGSEYSCPTFNIYNSCKTGYYMTLNGTYNGTPALGNKCTVCPDNATYCPGGTDAPVYEITLNGNGGLPNMVIYRSASAGYCDTADNCTASNKETMAVQPPVRDGYSFVGYAHDASGSNPLYINASGMPSATYASVAAPATWYAKWTAKTYTCSSGQFLNGTECKDCTEGYYCPTTQQTYTYNGSAQGRTSCTTIGTGWTSASGAAGISQCYYPITLNKNGFSGTLTAGTGTGCKVLATAEGTNNTTLALYYNTACTLPTFASNIFTQTGYMESSTWSNSSVVGGTETPTIAAVTTTPGNTVYYIRKTGCHYNYYRQDANICAACNTSYPYSDGGTGDQKSCYTKITLSKNGYSGTLNAGTGTGCTVVSKVTGSTNATLKLYYNTACTLPTFSGFTRTGYANSSAWSASSSIGASTLTTIAASTSAPSRTTYYVNKPSCAANYYKSNVLTCTTCGTAYPYSVAGTGDQTSCYAEIALNKNGYSGTLEAGSGVGCTVASKASGTVSATLKLYYNTACTLPTFSGFTQTGYANSSAFSASNEVGASTVATIAASTSAPSSTTYYVAKPGCVANYYKSNTTTCTTCGTAYPYSVGGTGDQKSCYAEITLNKNGYSGTLTAGTGTGCKVLTTAEGTNNSKLALYYNTACTLPTFSGFNQTGYMDSSSWAKDASITAEMVSTIPASTSAPTQSAYYVVKPGCAANYYKSNTTTCTTCGTAYPYSVAGTGDQKSCYTNITLSKNGYSGTLEAGSGVGCTVASKASGTVSATLKLYYNTACTLPTFSGFTQTGYANSSAFSASNEVGASTVATIAASTSAPSSTTYYVAKPGCVANYYKSNTTTCTTCGTAYPYSVGGTGDQTSCYAEITLYKNGFSGTLTAGTGTGCKVLETATGTTNSKLALYYNTACTLPTFSGFTQTGYMNSSAWAMNALIGASTVSTIPASTSAPGFSALRVTKPGCAANFYKKTDSACSRCSTGTNSNYPSSVAGTKGLEACYLTTTSGKYVETAGAGEVDCKVGSYCVGNEKIYYTDGVGATTGGSAECAAGTFTSTAGNSVCTLVAEGCYSDTPGATSSCPKLCPGGTYGATAGLTTAACSGLCEIGYYCPAGSTSATQNACTGATYSDVEGLASCKACPTAKQYSGAKLGYYWNETGLHTTEKGCNATIQNPTINNGTLSSVICYLDENGDYGTADALRGTWGCEATKSDLTCNGGYYTTKNNKFAFISLQQLAANTCEAVGSGYYSPAGDVARYACSALDSNKTDGTYSSVSPYDAATTCRFVQNQQTVPTYCATKTSNTMKYTSSGWEANTYAVTAKTGAYISGNNTASATCTQCTGATYCENGVKKDCPAAETGWTLGTGNGWSAVTSCFETTTPSTSKSPIATICTAGTLTKKATSTTAWGTATASGLTAKAGRYVDGTTCSACAAGTYTSSASTAISCTPAPKGSFVAGTEKTSATECALGSYTDTTGQSSCKACQNGTTTSDKGQTSCNATCANNNDYDNAWMTATWSNNGVSNLCRISNCKAGSKYASASSYTNTTGTCTACEAGEYQSLSAHKNTTCYAIKAGCFGADAGSTSDCPASCPAAETGWTLSSTTGLTKVTDCTETTTPSTSKSPIATICTAGTLTKKATSTTAWGTATASGLTAKAGRYVDGTTCSACAAGTYTSSASTAVSCTPAEKGSFVAGTEATASVQCALGSYTDATGQSSCKACQNGTTTSGTGQASCNATCANNNDYDNAWSTATWSNNSVSNLCRISNCKAGSKYGSSSYSNTLGSCTACAAGTYQSASAHTNTTCSAVKSGCFGGTDGATSNCPSSCPTGYSGSDSNATSNRQCYKSCSAKSISNGKTTVVNAKEYYNGSAYPACTYNVNCNSKYGASGNKTANPACTLCETGYYSAGGTATCQACTIPGNSTATSNGSSASACTWECNSGYVRPYDFNSFGVHKQLDKCEQLCTAGVTHIKTDTGLSIPLYVEPQTSPALNVQYGGTVCYASLTMPSYPHIGGGVTFDGTLWIGEGRYDDDTNDYVGEYFTTDAADIVNYAAGGGW